MTRFEAMRGILAIEGASGSGKTTLAGEIATRFGCVVLHMDDFFLPANRRTDEIAGNIDRTRFLEEVLTPLSRGETFDYIAFDCKSQTYRAPVRISPTPLVVVEGAYSMHPDFAEFYTHSVFLTVEKDVQKARILKRPNAQDFFTEWLPREERYFKEFDIPNKCEIRI